MRMIKSCLQRFRHWKYRLLSDDYNCLSGKPDLRQPLLIKGNGSIQTGEHVKIGFESSAGFWNTYAYMDVRNNGTIRIEQGVILNNNAALTADGTQIFIGENTVSGIGLTISTSDGHSLLPELRHSEAVEKRPVYIGQNVFLGDHVTILKGVTIGSGSVIGSDSVVTSDIPEQSVAAGNPCRIIRSVREQ